jgi:predicted O-linked N-acetylglucosamine transferase (SPINDLY family)
MICPELNYTFNYKQNQNTKIKVAFISDFLIRMHSVFKDRHQIIKKLSKDKRFEVYVITINNLEKLQKYIYRNAKHIKIEQNLSKARDTIENFNLDYLVYCEIGMNPFFYYLAHMKLARIQINTWGHSDTSGINTIDYFMSSKLYETDIAQNNYSEKLVILNSLCTCYINPILKYKINNFKDRYYFGFSKTSNIYICPQSIFKLLPEFDEYLLDILKKDENSIIVLQDAIARKKDKIIKRLETHNINLSRLHFIGMVAHNVYMNYIYISDVMLDPYPFGGCNSSLEAFSMGVPVVTRPSKMINGRFTSGFYKKMNILDLICNDKDEYVEKAIKIVNDKEYKNNIVNKIKDNNHILFKDNESFVEWRDFLIQNK